jgi:Uma2 family endonuclease
MISIEHPPRTGMELFKILPEGTLCELIENTIYMSPSPNTKHQRISLFIATTLLNYVTENNLGEVFVAAYDVYLNGSNAVQPDILFIANNNLVNIQDDGFYGCPDLIIELLSPSNTKHDLVTKKELYEKFGVKEYFIINPENKTVISYFLSENKFKLQVSTSGQITSKQLNSTFTF